MIPNMSKVVGDGWTGHCGQAILTRKNIQHVLSALKQQETMITEEIGLAL